MTTPTYLIPAIDNARPYSAIELQRQQYLLTQVATLLTREEPGVGRKLICPNLESILGLGLDIMTAGTLLARLAETISHSVMDERIQTQLTYIISNRTHYAPCMINATRLSERAASIILLQQSEGDPKIIRELLTK